MNEKQKYLADNGVNFEQALSYLGDMETFDEILKDFYDGMDCQMEEIEKYKNMNDMANYAILVHALKSNCRSLGIIPFADVAYQHEMAGKENNVSFVEQHYNELVDIKEKYKQIIANYLNS